MPRFRFKDGFCSHLTFLDEIHRPSVKLIILGSFPIVASGGKAMSVKRYSAKTDSKLKTCAANTLARTLACFLLFAISSGSLTGCDSQATVQWENKQRSEMKERIGSIFNDPTLADFYKDLTSNLTENERQLVNAILQIVIDRNPQERIRTRQ